MPRPRVTDEERADQRRELRRAAADLYREGGLDAISVRAVAKRAGVSTGLLYSYFGNLSDLMRSLWMGPIVDLGRKLVAVESGESDPVDRIRGLLESYVNFAVENADTHRGLLLWVRPPGSTTDRNDDPDDLLLFAALRRAVVEGQDAGLVREGDPRALAQLLWSGVHGALSLPINTDTYDLISGPKMAPQMIDALIRSITTEDSP